MRIAVGCDHVGFLLKRAVVDHLKSRGHTVLDLGTDSGERTDYPLYGKAVAEAVASGACGLGVVLCGTGVGISIAANKVPGVRAVVCSEPYSALLSRRHNDTNVLAMGARVVGESLALMILDAFLAGEFEGGRHRARVDMLSALDRAREAGGEN